MDRKGCFLTICSLHESCFNLFLSYIFREFKKRMDADLPYYHWSLNERFSEDLPSFDDRPDFDDNEVQSNKHPLLCTASELISVKTAPFSLLGVPFYQSVIKPPSDIGCTVLFWGQLPYQDKYLGNSFVTDKWGISFFIRHSTMLFVHCP